MCNLRRRVRALRQRVRSWVAPRAAARRVGRVLRARDLSPPLAPRRRRNRRMRRWSHPGARKAKATKTLLSLLDTGFRRDHSRRVCRDFGGGAAAGWPDWECSVDLECWSIAWVAAAAPFGNGFGDGSEVADCCPTAAASGEALEASGYLQAGLSPQEANSDCPDVRVRQREVSEKATVTANWNVLRALLVLQLGTGTEQLQVGSAQFL